jgi:hypothetical protein
MISPMMAHKVKGVDSHYSNHDIEELKEKYKTALVYLIPQTVVYGESKKQLGDLQAQITDLTKEVNEWKNNARMLSNVLKNNYFKNHDGNMDTQPENET